MAFKEYDHQPSFLEIELINIIEKSRTQKFLSDVDSYIDWEPLESIVTSNYPVGQSDYGNKAYPPLMLLKAMLLQNMLNLWHLFIGHPYCQSHDCPPSIKLTAL